MHAIDLRWKPIYAYSAAQLVEASPAEVFSDLVNMADPGPRAGGSRTNAAWFELRGILIGGGTQLTAGDLRLYRHSGLDLAGDLADLSVGRALLPYKTVTIAASAIAAGAELVTNGDFALSTGWVTGPGWAIAAGKATHTAGQSGGKGRLSRTLAVTAGLQYIVALDVDSGDTVEVWVGNQRVLTSSGTGRQRAAFEAAATGTVDIAIVRASGTTATVIDNVLLKAQTPTRFHYVGPTLEGDNLGCGSNLQAGFLAAATMADTMMAMWVRRFSA